MVRVAITSHSNAPGFNDPPGKVLSFPNSELRGFSARILGEGSSPKKDSDMKGCKVLTVAYPHALRD